MAIFAILQSLEIPDGYIGRSWLKLREEKGQEVFMPTLTGSFPRHLCVRWGVVVAEWFVWCFVT